MVDAVTTKEVRALAPPGSIAGFNFYVGEPGRHINWAYPAHPQNENGEKILAALKNAGIDAFRVIACSAFVIGIWKERN